MPNALVYNALLLTIGCRPCITLTCKCDHVHPGGGESMRLKLQTPLFIAEALLNASQQQLAVELVNAQQEAQALR